jgi:hypothetical protein
MSAQEEARDIIRTAVHTKMGQIVEHEALFEALNWVAAQEVTAEMLQDMRLEDLEKAKFPGPIARILSFSSDTAATTLGMSVLTCELAGHEQDAKATRIACTAKAVRVTFVTLTLYISNLVRACFKHTCTLQGA